MKTIKPIIFYLTEIDKSNKDESNKFAISIGHTDKFLRTPGDKVIQDVDSEIVKNIIYDLQRYETVEINDTFAIDVVRDDSEDDLSYDDSLGNPLTNPSLYSLMSSKLDYWSEDGSSETLDMNTFFRFDELLILDGGYEGVDQLYQWREIIELLKTGGFDLKKLARETRSFNYTFEPLQKLKNIICHDFDSSSPAHKSAFVNLMYMYGSPIASWAFCYKDLSENVFATSMSVTLSFKMHLESKVNDEIEVRDDIGIINEDVDKKTQEKIEKIKIRCKREMFQDALKIAENCRKFISLCNKKQVLIRNYLKSRETKTIEFKETFSFNVHTKKKDERLIHSTLKNICAFFNSNGGTLLVGVNDKSRDITGLDLEIEKLHKGDEDKLMTFFKDIFLKRVGGQNYLYLESEIIPVDDKRVLKLSCLPSKKPVFLDDKDFYVRTDPATDKLEGQTQLDYIEKRFKK